MFSWIPLLTFKHFFKHGSEANLKSKAACPRNFSSLIRSSYDKAFECEKSGRHNYYVMVFSLITVFLVTVYPYLPALNPTGRFVGVDIPFYEKKLLELNSLRDFPSIVSKAFISYADRPVSILLLFFGWKLTWLSAVEAAQFSLIILGLILVFATYMFARLLGFTQFSASMVMLFTSFSFHITVGMYGGFIANWIGLIFYYLFWGFLCLAMRSGSWLHCLTSMAFLGLLMFSHAETWGMSMASCFSSFPYTF